MDFLRKFFFERAGVFGGLIIVIIILSLIVVLIKLYLTTTNDRDIVFYAFSAIEYVFSIALAASVTGAVLKIFAIEGYFLDAVSGVVNSEKSLLRLNHEERKNKWRHLTQILFIPFSQTPDNHKNETVEKVARSVVETIENGFNFSDQLFIEKYEVEVIISNKKGTDIVDVTEILSCDIIPFSADGSAIYEMEFSADSTLTLNEYDFYHLSATLNGKDISRHMSPSLHDSKYVTRLSLIQHKKYELYRVRKVAWNYKKDPSFSVTSPYVLLSADYRIRNKTESMMLYVSEVGGSGFLRPISDHDILVNTGELMHKRCKGTLLPQQGIQIIFVEVGS